ncbi:acylphosphatase [Dyella sp.]|uniref:acylphosphatase n=1 Tax=Dyella sp. TaxID=1869338 RepID=UPI002B460A3F|nr:acylphosphatase [Dyella sp.]HKT29265.1 acylphosphatase [Dyella sp.]
MSTARFMVSGRVQGVFFRASTRNEAVRLGLHGHARNLADGGVEVIAKGNEDALRELEQWLWEGPPAAKVTQVARMTYDGDVREGFWVL